MSASVTVVIPVYRSLDTLERAVASVLAQSVPPLETLVIDDGSGEDVAGFVEARFSGRVTVVTLPENRGAAAARNEGIRLAQGEFVAFLDADDEWYPAKLERQLPCFFDTRVDLVVCDCVFNTLDGIPTRLYEFHQPVGGPAAWKRLLRSNFIANSTVVARRERLRVLGGFDTGIVIGEDYDLWLRMTKTGHLAFVPEVLATFHERVGSLTNRHPYGEIREVLPMVRRHLAAGGASVTREERRAILGNQEFHIAHRAFLAGAGFETVRLFLDAAWNGFRPLRSLRLATQAAVAVVFPPLRPTPPQASPAIASRAPAPTAPRPPAGKQLPPASPR